MTPIKLLGWIATVIVAPTVVSAWFVPWLQSLTTDSAKTGALSLVDGAIYWITYPVEVSVLTILVAVSIVAWFLATMARKRTAGARPRHQGASRMTVEDIKKLAELADQDDYREVVKKNGQVATLKIVPLENFSQEERRLLRVLSLTDLAPVPAQIASAIFESNVAMAATLNSLQAKNMIDVADGHVLLTPSGVAWAHHQLRNGLGKRFPPVRPEPPTPDLSSEQVFVLKLLSKDAKEQDIDFLRMATGMSELRFGHALDVLKVQGLVQVTGNIRRGTYRASLTSEGRAYVVQHNLDSQEDLEDA